MRFEASQHMKLSQQMKLAPRMIQSMEILQLPMLALQERIEQELESNVALEQVDPGTDEDRVKPSGDEDRREEALERRELVVGEDSPGGTDDWERLGALESTYREAFDNEYSSQRYSPSRMAGERDRKIDAMAGIPARGESLTEQLLNQWRFADVEQNVAAVGECIIGYIDDDGLLGADLETILDQNRNVPGVEMTITMLEKTLAEIQHWLDPPGIGARDHRECFLLQIERARQSAEEESTWNDARLLIEDHYDDLLQNRLPRIAQKAEISMERIHAAMRLMRRLSVDPGRDLVEVEVPPIIPDVVVEYDEQADEYIAGLSDSLLPTLRVSSEYANMARDRSVDKETREFVGRNVRNATWLIDSINQRKNTLLRVVNVVLARQREFFDHGPQHLKPLPMLEVADQLGIHVGTVSRAVADKWMQTPRGLIALRKFFSGGTATDGGKDMSWEAVKATLQEIIDAEDKSKPLSDEALAGELKKRGIDIARRTVVKYRQQLDIPPARRRRVYGGGE
ncbi:MAG: RNA polymerase factor sigma-54 [Phycisphaerales bacterium]|nr:MAG: RNA polymerase factor sigma-54 [Phycisphaerales bacterium]